MPVEVYQTTTPIAVKTTTRVEEHRSLGDKAKDVLHDIKDVVTGEGHITHKDIAKAQKKEMKMRDKEEKYEAKRQKEAAKTAHLQRKHDEQQERRCRQHGICPPGCGNVQITRITEFH
uniref:Uncharacterized protein n=1 Tax=Plectus sambesii TaxID=2011161 RepID=A0A914VLF8_9BILA